MKQLACCGVLLIGLAWAGPESAHAQAKGGFGLRAGIGTDITGGIAYGGAINYAMYFGKNALELGLDAFGGSFEETTEEYNTYTEKTDLLVVGILANYLLQYNEGAKGVYFVLGFGAGAISYEWTESSPTDISLGTPLPGGGSKQEEDGTTGGSIINLGVGYSFSPKADLRLQAPVFYIWDTPGSTSVVPTVTLSAGLRF